MAVYTLFLLFHRNYPPGGLARTGLDTYYFNSKIFNRIQWQRHHTIIACGEASDYFCSILCVEIIKKG